MGKKKLSGLELAMKKLVTLAMDKFALKNHLHSDKADKVSGSGLW